MTDEERLDLTEAHQHEAGFFDAVWQRYEEQTPDLRIPDDEAMFQRDLGRSLVVFFDILGELGGRRVLELGCGPGEYTVMLARRGAQVTAIDLAPSALALVRRRAEIHGLTSNIHMRRMSAERLDFSDASFDLVVGSGLLHHADLAAVGPEVRRVLADGGRALFREPLGCNPVLEFARSRLPYRRKVRSQNERPLTYEAINLMGRHFWATRTRELYLFSMITRAVGSEMSFPVLWALDEWLLRRFPWLRRYCRYVIVEYLA
jgi:SAM-dependent methyltransferase